jgi:hypothetical protein
MIVCPIFARIADEISLRDNRKLIWVSDSSLSGFAAVVPAAGPLGSFPGSSSTAPLLARDPIRRRMTVCSSSRRHGARGAYRFHFGNATLSFFRLSARLARPIMPG